MRTVSAAREEAETDAGKHLSERITSVLRAKHGDLRSFFDVADKNGDGVLSAEEVKAALQQHVGISLNGTELAQIILWADKDRSGALSIQEAHWGRDHPVRRAGLGGHSDIRRNVFFAHG